MPDEKKPGAGISRRTLCIGAAGAAAMLGLGCVRFVPENSMLRPPGGQDEDHLLSACIRCEKCLAICPRDIIKPAHIEQGLLSARTPTLSFAENWCDFCAEANGGTPLCVQACPTQALALPADAAANTYVMGMARITEAECLAFRLTGCHSCYDACPYDAMRLDSDGIPHVIEEKCTGCGACEAACISLESGSISSGATRRAIYIEPLAER